VWGQRGEIEVGAADETGIAIVPVEEVQRNLPKNSNTRVFFSSTSLHIEKVAPWAKVALPVEYSEEGRTSYRSAVLPEGMTFLMRQERSTGPWEW
jgi:hypothetical protein